MITNTLKIQIVKPLDTDWVTLRKILNDLRYETWKLANKAMQMCWEFDNISYEYFGKYKESLNLKEHPFKSDKGKDIISLSGYIYNKLSKDITEKMKSEGISATIKMVLDNWKSNKQDIINGRISVSDYKINLPIEINTPQIQNTDKTPNIYIDDNGYYNIGIKLISSKYAKEVGRKGTETTLHLALAVKDNYQKAIVDRLISGEYKLSMSKITKNKNKWFLLLAYSFKQVKKELDKNKIMGIDLGVNIPAMLAISDDKYYRESVGDKEEIFNFKYQMKNRRARLARQRKWCGEGSRGHGVKTRLKPLQKLRDLESNFRNTVNHKYSRFIVDEALKHGCGVIQMEDLTGISSDNMFLKNWTYYDLQQKITYKAEKVGIKVIKINPYKTSQRCNCCGYISKKNRDIKVSQEKFKCVQCEFESNADWNAAKNIATKDIEKLIKKQMEKQEKEMKHAMKYEA